MSYYIAIPCILRLILFSVYILVRWIRPTESNQKETPFECGFDPIRSMRKPFSIRFYILIILFLIFDVEVVLLFPLIIIIKTSNEVFLLWRFTAFLLMLLAGLFYEWKIGALDWISK